MGVEREEYEVEASDEWLLDEGETNNVQVIVFVAVAAILKGATGEVV